MSKEQKKCNQSKSKTTKKQQSNEIKKFYRGRYHIVFYDRDDDTYVAGFDSVKDICRYKGLQVTTTNIIRINGMLLTALKKDPPTTRMLGSSMYVYLVDMIKKDSD